MMRGILTLGALVVGITSFGTGCTAQEELLSFYVNASRDPEDECKATAEFYLPSGGLDLADSTDPAVVNAREYVALLVVKTNLEDNSQDRSSEGTYGYFGTRRSDEIIIDEVVTDYEFVTETLPTDATLDKLERLVQPVYTFLSNDTSANGGPDGSAFVVADLIPRGVGELFNRDTAIGRFMQPPARYPVVVNITFRGHQTNGMRREAGPFSYVVELCKGCYWGLPNKPRECYPQWQDQG